LFGFRDVGIFQIFYSRAVIQRTIVDFPAFLEHGSAEKIAVGAHTNRDPNKQEVGFFYCMKRLLKSFQKFKTKTKKIKNPIAMDDFFKACPMTPLSCRSNLAGRYLYALMFHVNINASYMFLTPSTISYTASLTCFFFILLTTKLRNLCGISAG
jgi:hypothetical protein